MNNSSAIFAFDFDGTLTTCDTLPAFIRHVCGTRRLLCGIALDSPVRVLMKLRLYPNWKAKQRIFAHFFGGMAEREFDGHCADFARAHRHLLRPGGVDTLQRALGQGARVAVVSASVDRWVRPFFGLPAGPEGAAERAAEAEAPLVVIGTQVEVAGGRLTGRFLTPNCYGPEKVRRLRAAFPDLPSRRLVAFGDSRGDRELLQIAAEAHYKPFRQLSVWPFGGLLPIRYLCKK